MGEFDGNNGDGRGQREPPDPTMFAGMPPGGYEPHPLFPREDDGPEDRDICYVTFRRKRSDGRIDNCPEDIPAGEIQSWADVTGPWGGGEYKAIGKDRKHRIVAWYPPKNGEWLLFDQESKPFTLRNGHRYRPAVTPPAAPAAASPPSPPQPPAPPPPSPTETLMLEILRELRARPNPPAAPAPTASIEAVLIAALNAQGEMTRAALTAALTQRPADGSATAVELLRVMREWAPQAQAPGSMSERLGEYKQIRELTTPAPAMPPPSEFGDIKDLLMSVMQADAISKTTAREDPPPPSAERRPPPPRRPVVYLPGLGMVDEADVQAVLSDPAARARMRNALGLAEPPAMAAPIAPPAFSPMVAAPAHVHPGSAAQPPPVAPISAPVPIAPTPAPPVQIAPTPAPASPSAPSMPSAPASTVDVASPDSPRPTPVHDVNVEAMLADPGLRERVVKALAAARAGEASHVAEPPPSAPSAVRPQPTVSTASAAPMVSSAAAPTATPTASSASTPSAAPTEPSAPATTTAPTVTNAPAPSAAPTVPIVTTASDDQCAPIAEPMQTAERETRVITEDDRMRAVPALRTIARMPRDQARAELKKLPGMRGQVEELEKLMQVFGFMGDLPPDMWANFVAELPAEAVRVLVDGPGG